MSENIPTRKLNPRSCGFFYGFRIVAEHPEQRWLSLQFGVDLGVRLQAPALV